LYKAIAALVVAVLTARCTSVEHGRGSTAPPPGVQTAQSTPHQPVPDLKARLLTLADLPAGWSIDNSSSGDEPSTPPCLQRPDSKLHTNDKANASFVKGSSGLPAFAQAIGYLGDNAPRAARSRPPPRYSMAVRSRAAGNIPYRTGLLLAALLVLLHLALQALIAPLVSYRRRDAFTIFIPFVGWVITWILGARLAELSKRDWAHPDQRHNRRWKTASHPQ